MEGEETLGWKINTSTDTRVFALQANLSLSAVASVFFDSTVCVSSTEISYIVQSLVFLTQFYVGCSPDIFDAPNVGKFSADGF